MIPIFPCSSRRSKGLLSGSEVFLRLLVEVLGPPYLPKFSPMANGYTDTECYTTRRVISGPKMSENAQFEGRMYFPTKYLRPYTPNHPKTPFWGPFKAKPIISVGRSCTLMEIRSWNFTAIYCRYKQVFWAVKIYLLGDLRWAQGLLM